MCKTTRKKLLQKYKKMIKTIKATKQLRPNFELVSETDWEEIGYPYELLIMSTETSVKTIISVLTLWLTAGFYPSGNYLRCDHLLPLSRF